MRPPTVSLAAAEASVRDYALGYGPTPFRAEVAAVLTELDRVRAELGTLYHADDVRKLARKEGDPA